MEPRTAPARIRAAVELISEAMAVDDTRLALALFAAHPSEEQDAIAALLRTRLRRAARGYMNPDGSHVGDWVGLEADEPDPVTPIREQHSCPDCSGRAVRV